MESSYSPFTYPQNLYNFDELLKYSVNTDDKMERVNQAEDVQFCDCNRNKEILAKREEIVWQREDLIHTRERELREREKILADKNKELLEKQRQLKCLEEKVVNVDDKHSSGDNGRVSSESSAELYVPSNQNENNELKSEVLSEKMKLLLEKEKVISEKIENIEMRERSILSKENFLKDEKVILETERELIAEKMRELVSREQIIKNNEECELKALYEDKKTVDDSIELLSQKEKVLSIATEIMQNKEQFLNERENTLIEKEKYIINLINGLNDKYIFNEHPNKRNEIFEKFDKIFNEKMRVILQRENTIRTNELVLQEKWKKYNEAKELLKFEEENLAARKTTFEKEVQNLKCWEMFHENPEIEIMKKCENSNVNMRKESCSSSQCFLKEESNFVPNVNTNSSVEDKNIHDENETSDLKCREISGNELLESLEKVKESVQKSLFKEVELSGKELESDHTINSTPSETVRSFFNKVILNEKVDETVSAPRLNGENRQTSEIASATVENKTFILTEKKSQNDDPKSDIKISTATKHTYVCQEGSSHNFEHCILDSHSKEEKILDSSHQETQITSKAVEAKGEAKNFENNRDVYKGNTKSDFQSNESTAQKCINEAMQDKKEKESIKSNENTSKECEIEENGHDTTVINYICSDVSKSLSRSSSASSVRSLIPSISDQSVTLRTSVHKRPARDALLKAISNKNFLETEQLLDSNHVSLKVCDDQGRTAFLLAVESGNKELVQRLIKMHCDVRACDFRGNSALHIAVSERNVEMVLFLLQNQLNPGLTNNDGINVLQLASKINDKTMVDLIKNLWY